MINNCLIIIVLFSIFLLRHYFFQIYSFVQCTIFDPTQHSNFIIISKCYMRLLYAKMGKFSLGFFIVLWCFIISVGKPKLFLITIIIQFWFDLSIVNNFSSCTILIQLYSTSYDPISKCICWLDSIVSYPSTTTSYIAYTPHIVGPSYTITVMSLV